MALTATSTLRVTHAAAAKLVFTQQPSASTISGQPFAVQPTVQVQDRFGNIVSTGDDATRTIALTLNGTGSISGTASLSATGGEAEFSGLAVAAAGSGKTFTATSVRSGVTFTATSAAFRIAPSTASLSQSTVTATAPSLIANGTSATTVTVSLKDAQGNSREVGGETVTISSTLGTVGTVLDNGDGTYSATLTAPTTTGTATVSATVGGSSITSTATVAMVAGLPNRIVVINGDNLTATAGSPVNADGALKVKVVDAFDNVRTGDALTVAIASGNGTLAATGLGIGSTGEIAVPTWTLGQTAGVNRITVTLDTNIAIKATIGAVGEAGPVTHFSVTYDGGSTALSTKSLTSGTPVKARVSARDQYDNVNANWVGQVSLTSTGAGQAFTTTVAANIAANGYVDNVSVTPTIAGSSRTITAAGDGTGASPDVTGSTAASGFTVVPGALSRFSVTKSGGNGALDASVVAGTSFSARVTAYDAQSNVITGWTGSVALSSTSFAGTVTATIATNGYVDAVSIRPTITQSAAAIKAVGGGIETASAASFEVTPGKPVGIRIATQPVAGASESVFATAPVIELLDGNGNVATGDSSAEVIVTASGGTLSGTTTRTASSGVVSFGTGTGVTALGFAGSIAQTYTLTFSLVGAPTAVTVTSNQIQPTGPGAATALDVTGAATSPSGSGAAFATQPTVKVLDQYGNLVTSSTATISAGVSTGGSLVGTTTTTAQAGVARFGNLGITGTAGATYTITFSSGSLTTDSQTVEVGVGEPTQLSVETQPEGAVYATAMTQQPVVQLRDSGGNAVSRNGVSVTASLASGTGALSSFTATTGADGRATFSGLALQGDAVDAVGTALNYSMAFTSPGLASATSGSFTLGKKAQTISFAPTSSVNFGSAQLALSGTANSGLAVTYALGVNSTALTCSVTTAGVVTFGQVGTCEIVASQSGDRRYLAAPSVTKQITVAPVAPGKPFITSVSAGNGSATAAFSAPAFTGGATITGYTLVATKVGDASVTVTNSDCPATSPCTITGLALGIAYTLTVAAENSAGLGDPSAASTSVTPVTNPDAVTNLVLTPGVGSVGATWTALSQDQLGGGKFTKYEISFRQTAAEDWTPCGSTCTGGSLTDQQTSSVSITGLVSGVSYDVKVVAITEANATEVVGNTATASESPYVVPGRPTGLNATKASATSVTLSWSAPSSDGGTPITGYVTEYYDFDSGVWQAFTGTSSCVVSTRTCTITDLEPFWGYQFRVFAKNAVGDGLPSTSVTYTTPSNDTSVLDVRVSGISLVPDGSTYSDSVLYGKTSTTLYIAAADGSTMTINGVPAARGTWIPVSLATGTNTFTVVVTAEDEITTSTYSIVITRAGPPTKLTVDTPPLAGLSEDRFTRMPIIIVQSEDSMRSTDATNQVTVTASGGTLSGTTTITASTGVARFTDLEFTGVVGREYTLTFSSPGLTPVTATISPTGPGAPSAVRFARQPSESSVAGAAFDRQPKVEIVDQMGNVASSTADVVLSLSSGSGTLAGTTRLAASSGVADFSGLSIDKVGNDKVLTAMVDLGAGVTRTVTTSPAFAITPAAVDRIVMSQSATGSLTASTDRTVTATLVDAFDNTVTGATGSIAFTQSAGAGSLVGAPATVTVADGIATLGVSSGRVGATTLTATYPATGMATATGSTDIAVVEGPVASIELSGSSADLTTGGSRAFTATLRDRAGNVVSGGSPSITFAGTGTAGSALAGLGAQTATAGTATDTATSSTLGSASVTASVTVDGTTLTSDPVQFSVVAGQPAYVELTPVAAGDLAAGSTRTYTATVKDASGNPVPDLTLPVVFSKDGSGPGTVTGLGSVLTADGVATVTLSAVHAGSFTLKAAYGALTPDTETFSVVPGPIDQVLLTPSATGDLGAGSTRTLAVRIIDAFDNTVTSFTNPEVVTFAKTGGSGTVTSLGDVIASSGTASLEITGDSVGSIQIAASIVDGSRTVSSGPVAFSVVLGAPASIAFDSATTDLAAGADRTITATIKDIRGNVVTTSTADIAFTATASDGTVTGTGTVAAVGGVATKTISGNKAGLVTVTAELAGLPAQSATFRVVPGAIDSVSLTGSTDPLLAGATRTFTATLKDAQNNTVTDSSDSVTFTGTGAGTVTGLGSAAASSGVASVEITARTPGAFDVAASVSPPGSATISSATRSFTVEVGAPAAIALVASETSDLVAGETRALTATVRDGENNLIPSYANKVVFSQDGVNEGTVTGLGDASITSGEASVTVTAQAPGKVSLGASLAVVGGSTLTATPVTFTNVIGPKIALSLDTGPGDADYGDPLSVQPIVSLRDVAGNVVKEADVLVTATLMTGVGLGTGTVVNATALTNASGVAEFSGLRIDGAAGTYRLVFSATGLTAVDSGVVSISLKAQTITFANPRPSGVAFGVAPFAAAATASSGLEVAIASLSPLVCSATTTGTGASRSTQVTILGVGDCTLRATQAGDTRFSPADAVEQTIVVSKAQQAPLTMVSPSSVVFGTSLRLVATGGTGPGEITFAASPTSACTVEFVNGQWQLVPGNAGTDCEVTATKASSAFYLEQASSPQAITTMQAAQVVTFSSRTPNLPLPGTTYRAVASVISAATGLPSGLAPVIGIDPASASVCSINGAGLVSFTTSGTCTVTADQPGNANFMAARQATQSILVGSLNQTISFPQPATTAFGSPSVPMGARASSGLDIEYSLGSSTTNSACTVSPTGGVSIDAVGTCEVVASQPGDAVYAAASPVTRKFTITPGLPTMPHVMSVSAGDERATVLFTAPSFTGGVDLASYEVTATPVGVIGGTAVTKSDCAVSSLSVTPPPCTVTGLVNGIAYELSVAAVNSAGKSEAAEAANSVTPASRPDAVSDVTARPGNGTITLTWSPITEAQLGGGTFLGYDIAYRLNETGAEWVTCLADTCTGDLTDRTLATTTISGLQNAKGYELRIAAFTLANSEVLDGNTSYVTEFPATEPSAPRTPTVLRLTPTTVEFSWQEPVSDGGAALKASEPYVVEITPPAGAAPLTCTIVAGERSCEVSEELENGGAYKFSVYAQNRMGAGPAASVWYSVPDADATLTGLTVSAGTLSPIFTPSGTGYTVSVPFEVTELTVAATVAPRPVGEPQSVIEIQDVETASAAESAPVALQVGENEISVVVFAPDPRHRTTYSITVTRLPAPPPPPQPSASVREEQAATPVVPPSLDPVLPPEVILDNEQTVAVLIDGVLTEIEVSKNPRVSALEITGDGFSVSVQTVNSDRTPVAVPGTNGLTAPLGGWVDMNATGYAPDSSVAAYLVPRTQVRARAGLVPREATGVIALGMAAVDSSGSSLHAFGIPTDLASGEYVLQINGIAENNTVRSVNVDMQVTAPRTSTPRVMVGACSFPGASVTLTRECRVSLSALASSTGRGASPVRVQITGVAYGRDTIVENRSLARDRAQAITRYLDRLGVDAVAKIATVTKIGVSPGLTMQPAPVLASSDGRPASTVALTVPPPT